MTKKVTEIAEQHRALAINPASTSVENRTVEVIFATETPVLTRNWNVSERSDGLMWEILSCDPAHVRMERLNGGAPVLDSHAKYSVKTDQLGVVDSGKFENKQGSAVIRFSKRADVEPVFQDVVDKIIQNVSGGYRVYTYESVAGMGEDKVPTFRAIDWEPTEISLTPVQADPNSKVRAENQTVNSVEIINQNQRTMPENVNIPAAEVEGTRAVTTAPAPAPAPAATAPAITEAERTAAVELSERTRALEIMSAVRSANLDHSFGEKLIKDGTPVDQARKLVIDEFAKQDPNKGASSHITMGADETDKVRSAVSDAIVLRCNPSMEKGMKPEQVSVAREFRSRSLFDITRSILERSGVKTSMLSDREIFTRALSTSDLPNIFASTVNRTLLTAYEEAPRTFMPFCRRSSMRDFREITRTQLSSLPTLSLVKEGGEYTFGKVSDSKEAYSLAKYGEIIPITWESIVNDDLSAFDRLPIMLANAAAQKQSDIVYGILMGSGLMSDGIALFDASTHGNYVSSGTTITAGLAAAYAAMQKQKGLGAAGTKASGFYLNIEPKFLICGPDKRVEAWQNLNGIIVAAAVANANPFQGTMTPIVEPRITGNTWYLAAEPGRVDTIEYAFLDGEPELFSERRTGFETDGLEIKVRMVFGAKAIDHRGLYKNAGA